MKILTWNCQGVRNPLTIHNLKRMLKIHSPDILCLLKTKNNLGFSGDSFTWNNRRGGNANIRERLDRGLVSPQWLCCYSNASIMPLEDDESDHRSILLNTNSNCPKLKTLFYFDERWLNNNEIEELIKIAWEKQRTSNPNSR
ncbi:hypothetical protein MANES_10G111001v8 [Manihot esculenta]|uniref:Uncharacterized protein n=1 Tax=Manihot esculenta TaxID=3983 RepID=A0ACB7H1F7_MANES|nr:hypothetical protein MANES_10G111001v8 [Manihot esculenta]